MKKKILFLANDMSGGLGHVRRCSQLASVMHQGGWKCAFIYHNRRTNYHLPADSVHFEVPLILDRRYTVLRSLFSPVHHFPKEKLESEPYFWEFHSLNYQVLRDGYFTPWIVERRLNRILKIVDEWKPEVLIGDAHLLTALAGKIRQIPVVQVLRFFAFPENKNFIWWKEIEPGLTAPPALNAFEPVFNRLGEDLPPDASHLLKGNGYLFPGTKEIEPVETGSRHLFYGYHVRTNYDHRLLQLEPRKNSRKIYVTIGGGAHRSHLDAYYQMLFRVCKTMDCPVIISDPANILKEVVKSEQANNIRVYRWIEASTIFPYLDLVVHHGGYGTTMESLWWGVPSLVIPFHSEQEGNGRRLEQIGAGEILPVSPAPMRTVWFQSYYGKFSMRGGFDFALTQEKIQNRLTDLLASSVLKNNAMRISRSIREQYDCDKILQFINGI